MNWLAFFIARFAMGERWRKSTPAERGFASAAFLFIPIFLFVFGRFGEHLLGNPGTFVLWLYMTGGGAVTVFWLVLWAKHVPARYSVAAGVAVWVVALWLALTTRFAKSL